MLSTTLIYMIYLFVLVTFQWFFHLCLLSDCNHSFLVMPRRDASYYSSRRNDLRKEKEKRKRLDKERVAEIRARKRRSVEVSSYRRCNRSRGNSCRIDGGGRKLMNLSVPHPIQSNWAPTIHVKNLSGLFSLMPTLTTALLFFLEKLFSRLFGAQPFNYADAL